MQLKIINGDNLEILKNYPDNYFDAVVTDPPYGLGKEPNAEELMKDWIEKGYHKVKGSGFMGKDWDAFVPQPIFWKEVFRVLKPGGHVVSFFGTRTYDWGVMAMRFAGFEVRDCIQWLYGSGFPKSHNISKAIDKMYGAEREIVGSKITGTMNNKGGASVNKEGWDGGQKEVEITAASTDQAKEWEGWGSALKPANEPIVLARKPLEKGLSIAENVLKWKTGAINIDGCRIGHNEEQKFTNREQRKEGWNMDNCGFDSTKNTTASASPQGRFPANLILSCSCENEDEHNEDCPIKILDEQSLAMGMHSAGASRFFYVAKASKSERNKGLEGFEEKQSLGGGGLTSPIDENGNFIVSGDKGTAGKYGSAKAPSTNFHPTVKPIKLMQYLVRLVTPANGIVLDTFCGSGTTGIACKLEGFQFVGIEQDSEYHKIAEARIMNYVEEVKETKIKEKTEKSIKQQTLFNNENI